MAQAISEEDAAAARLSFLQALMWIAPASFEMIPMTPARRAKMRKNIVAPFPPKPEPSTQSLSADEISKIMQS